MYNEYLRLQPLKGVSGQEATAFTKKTIKQLLIEEAAEAETEAEKALAERAFAEQDQAEDQAAAIVVATPAPKPQSALQQPPHMRSAMPEPIVATSEPAAAPVAESPVEKPRSFLKRLIKR